MYLYILMTNFVFLQDKEFDFFKVTKLGENAVTLGVLLVIFEGLKLFGWWLKNKKSKNDEVMQVVKDSLVAIKDQGVTYGEHTLAMNKSLDEIKTSISDISGMLNYLMGKGDKR